MNTLQGKTALVTGASRGIGRATALALAHAGARVLVHYRQAAFEANAVVADIRRIGGQADVLKVDLAATNGPAVLAQNAHEFLDGRLDILVLNAGISKAAPVEKQKIEEFDSLFSTNLRSPFLYSSFCHCLVKARTSFSFPRSSPTQCLGVRANRVRHPFRLTPPQRARSTRSPNISLQYWDLVAFA